jgi:hypothetical protein
VALVPGRYGTAREAVSMALCAAAELPQTAESGIALGYKTVVGGRFLATLDVRPAAPEVRKSTLARAFQNLPSTASAQSWPNHYI